MLSSFLRSIDTDHSNIIKSHTAQRSRTQCPRRGRIRSVRRAFSKCNDRPVVRVRSIRVTGYYWDPSLCAQRVTEMIVSFMEAYIQWRIQDLGKGGELFVSIRGVEGARQ